MMVLRFEHSILRIRVEERNHLTMAAFHLYNDTIFNLRKSMIRRLKLQFVPENDKILIKVFLLSMRYPG